MSGRQEWFDRCVDAVARVSPALAGRFVCPLCLTDFGSVDEVSQEHAPPHKLGGHRVALTCRTCNHSAGHQLDDDMRAFESQVDLGHDTMTAPVRVKVEAGGAKITASVIRTAEGIKIGGHPERSNPKEHDALFSHLDTLVADGTSEGESITMTFLDRFAPTNVSAGWLRAGYLVAFAKLGYSYILRPELDPVRAQIANPTTEHAPRAVSFEPTLPPARRGFWLVEEPDAIAGIYIGIGRWSILLPGLGPGTHFYESLAEYEPWPPPSGTARGRDIFWPTHPELFFDWVDVP